MAEASSSGTAGGTKIVQQEVLYCAVCSYPPEYCEFNAKSAKCKAWLEEAHPALFAKFYSDSAIDEKLANLTVEQRAALDKDLAKKEKKEEAKAEKEKAKLAASNIVIKRTERSKKKWVTTINGLDLFDIDLKKAAKLFANKLGAGATVSKTPQGGEEILIQGDASMDVEEMLLSKEDKKAVALFGDKITLDQITHLEEKLKVKKIQPPIVAPQFPAPQ